MGTTLDEPLYYELDAYTCVYGPAFLLNFYTLTKSLSSFWRRCRGEVFVLILTTAHLDITLDQYLFFIYFLFFYYFIILFNFIHFTFVLVTWSLLLFVCVFQEVNFSCIRRQGQGKLVPLDLEPERTSNRLHSGQR